MIGGVRGAPDLLPDETPRWQQVEAVARRVLEAYGYREIRTPIFERTELFVRGIGTTTDIVEKEMYTFLDKGGESLTLRPEGTASVVRAVLEHKLQAPGGLIKLYYLGPMFRHERPQSGRFRQFHQIGAEALGSDNPAVDAELLTLLDAFFGALGVRGLDLRLNSIGDASCRPAFRERFAAAMASRAAELCDDCRERLEKNPLRILDCKKAGCRRVTDEAPKPIAHLCEACARHFQRVRELLDGAGVRYLVDDRLVRGLDYYTRTTFEFVNPNLGAQNAVCGGGRYDGLAEEIGGSRVPAIGFAIGTERLIASLPPAGEEAAGRQGTYLATLGEAAFRRGFQVAQVLRRRGLRAALDLEGRSLKGQLRQADREGFRFCLILGEEELVKGEATLRDLGTGLQEGVSLDRVVDRIVAGEG